MNFTSRTAEFADATPTLRRTATTIATAPLDAHGRNGSGAEFQQQLVFSQPVRDGFWRYVLYTTFSHRTDGRTPGGTNAEKDDGKRPIINPIDHRVASTFPNSVTHTHAGTTTSDGIA